MDMLKIAQNPKTPSKVLARIFNLVVPTAVYGMGVYPNGKNSSEAIAIREKRILPVLIRNPNFPRSVINEYVEESLKSYLTNKISVNYEVLQEIVVSQELEDKQLEEILSLEEESYYSYDLEKLIDSLITSPKVKVKVKYNAALNGSEAAKLYLLNDGFNELSTYLKKESILGDIDSDTVPKEWIKKILGWDKENAYTY